MAREKGLLLEKTIKLRENIVELCRKEPRTYSEICTELGLSYQTAFNHISALKEEGKLITMGVRRGGKDLIGATKLRNIPHIPTPSGPVNPVEFCKIIVQNKGRHQTKLLQLEEKWPQTISGILRTAVVIKTEGVFPKDRHAEYETYLRIYREELVARLAQVNALIQTDKFWTKEGLTDFQNDPAFDTELILRAYGYCLQPEKKVE